MGAYPQNDASLYFQLGYLKYQRNNYSSAIQALERAVSLVPNFSNARYFLGLSYEKIGNKTEALKQFQEIAKLNPGNKEVESVINNLLMGRGAVTEEAPAVAAPAKTTPKAGTTTPAKAQ